MGGQRARLLGRDVEVRHALRQRHAHAVGLRDVPLEVLAGELRADPVESHRRERQARGGDVAGAAQRVAGQAAVPPHEGPELPLRHVGGAHGVVGRERRRATSFARRLRSATETAAASSSAKPKVGMRAASSTRSGPLTFVKSQLGSVGRIPRATSGAGSSTRSPIAASFGPMRASAGKPSSPWQE